MKRLVTRSDFDGLVCAMLLKELNMIDEVKFVHPNDVQHGRVELLPTDITTNLPFDPRVGLCFDHHASETERLEDKGIKTHGKSILKPHAKSAARAVYEYYQGRRVFHRISDELMEMVDKCDSADLTLDEILNPTGWVLLNYIMDARTGLGRFHDFRISNYDLMMQLIDYCLENPIEKVLALPDVKERTDLYFEQADLFKAQLERLLKVDGVVGILDFRNEDIIYAGNRFMVYALHPEIEISVHIAWGKQKENTSVMIGKSIVNRSSNKDIGGICYRLGNGGGHANAGTCQLPNDKVDEMLPGIIAALQ